MAKKRDDDLFQETTMTFGEHLEELRVALFKSLIALVIGVALGCWWADDLVNFIQRPLTKALQEYYRDAAIKKLERASGAGNGHSTLHSAEDYSALVKEGFLFEELYFEPDQILDELRDIHPESFEGIQRRQNTPGHPLSALGPRAFVAGDLKQPVELAKTLARGGTAEGDAGARHIWTLLSEDDRTAVQKFAAAASLTPEDAASFARILTRLIENPSLYSASAFESAMKQESLELSGLAAVNNKLTDDERTRFHRRLLEAAWPDWIAPTLPALVKLRVWHEIEDDSRLSLKSLSVMEPFATWFKAALVLGVMIASPAIFYYIWMFVAAGLYPHEQKYIYTYLPFSLALFLSGAAVAFFLVFEPVLQFLLSFNATLGIEADPRANDWFNFVLIMPIGFGVGFQLPLVMLFLNRIGLLSVETYLSKWRISVLVIVVLSAILTPADPTSIFYLAVPMVLLYFLGILLCKWFSKPVQAAASD